MEEENMVQDESSSQEYEGEGQYSEEEVDRIADTAIEAIQDILKYFNVGEVTIEEYEGDEGELILDITGDDLADFDRSPRSYARFASIPYFVYYVPHCWSSLSHRGRR